MQVTTGPVVVTGYGAYQRDQREGGGAMQRRDGSDVEYVEIQDDDSIAVGGGVRRLTLDPGINGNRPPVGARVSVLLRDWIEPDAKIDRRGRAYIGQKKKALVLAFGKLDKTAE